MSEAESLARKARSIERLRREGVPFIDHLPRIEAEDEAEIRPRRDVIDRALALCFVAFRGEGMPKDQVLGLLDEYKARHALSPNEKSFVESDSPSELTCIQYVWRYECLWVMLWALELVEELSRPERIMDVDWTVRLLKSLGREGLEEKARLRSANEILDEADLIYRYHWATRQARLTGEDAPAGLEPGVVKERHYALNWLIGCAAEGSWDAVSTDT